MDMDERGGEEKKEDGSSVMLGGGNSWKGAPVHGLLGVR